MVTNFKYFSEEERLGTFKKFAAIDGAPLCNPQGFAQAGFYSVATKRMPDLVKCFACEKELGNWEPGDDPWEEHIRRGLDCPFVSFRKNENTTLEDFIELNLSLARRRLTIARDESIENIKSTYQKYMDSIKEN